MTYATNKSKTQKRRKNLHFKNKTKKKHNLLPVNTTIILIIIVLVIIHN